MIRIALCDNDPNFLNELLVFLEQYRSKRGKDLAASSFHSSFDLLAAMEHGTRFDVLFLDTLMPGQNGIETAAKIRGFDHNLKIIFLASSSEFAVQSYTVNAYDYQLKPISSEIFFHILDSVFHSCAQERVNSFLLQHKGGIARIVIKQIEFCEIIHRTLLVHLASGKILESTGSLEELEKRLANCKCFIRIHRSYLINLDYVQNISYRAATMSCMVEIPIPRGKYRKIKDAFIKNASCKEADGL